MPVLEHKTKGRQLVPNGLSLMGEEELVMVISARECFVVQAFTYRSADP